MQAACFTLTQAPIARLSLARRVIRHQRFSTTQVRAMKATWEGATLAQSDDTVIVEGNHYFPPESIKREFFKDSATHSTCGWKGVASYYSIEVEGKVNKDAAWYYPKTTTDRAKEVEGRVAFWKGVTVTSD